MDEAAGLERRMDLEKAMETLKPQDREIIRMKYYVGMTIQEIADSLKLPYETVKKRHQRSLGRLRLALIAALVLVLGMLLAACAYIAMRYFGVVPGFGITEVPNLPVFLLEEEIVIENDVGKYVIEKGFLVGGDFVVFGKIYFTAEDMNTWRPNLTVDGKTEIATLQYGDETLICIGSIRLEEEWRLALEIRVEGLEAPEAGTEICEMTLNYAGVDFPLVFRSAGIHEIEEYDYWMGELGGVMIIPELENGNLLMQVYPLENHAEERIEIWEAAAEDEEGRKLQGQWINHMGGYGTMDFGPAEPGNYEVHFPDMKLYRPYDEDWIIRINLETCQWEDREYAIPGGTVSVTYCKPLEVKVGEEISDMREIVREDYSYWEIGLQYQMEETGGDTEVEPLFLQVDCPTLKIMNGAELTGITSVQEDTDGFRTVLVSARDDVYDITEFRLFPHQEVTILWKCDAVISFTVEE